MQDIRRVVREMATQRNESLTVLSRRIGRNATYLQQFLDRGTPRRLPEDIRLALAQHWQIDERRLGAREPWSPAP